MTPVERRDLTGRSPASARRRIPCEELDAATAPNDGLHGSVAAGHEPVSSDEMLREPIASPSPRGRRLQYGRGIRGCDQRHDRLAPASMMGKLHQVAAEVGRSIGRARREQCRGLRLDVARQEDARATVFPARKTLDAHDQRQVVVATRAPSPLGPQHRPFRRPDGEAISCRDDDDLGPLQPCGLEQFRCGRVSVGDLDDGVMHIERFDTRVADEVRDRAEVVDVGV